MESATHPSATITTKGGSKAHVPDFDALSARQVRTFERLTRRDFLEVHSTVAGSNFGFPNYMTSRQPFVPLAIFFGQASSMQSALFPTDLLVWSWLFQCEHQKINCLFFNCFISEVRVFRQTFADGQLMKVHCKYIRCERPEQAQL